MIFLISMITIIEILSLSLSCFGLSQAKGGKRCWSLYGIFLKLKFSGPCGILVSFIIDPERCNLLKVFI